MIPTLLILLCLAIAAAATWVEERQARRAKGARALAIGRALGQLRAEQEKGDELPDHAKWTPLLALLVLAGVTWLDAHGPHVGREASVFSWVVPVIGAIADFLGVVGGAVSTALSAVVTALAASVTWLLGALRSFMLATGSIFSKVWDGLKVVWNDALKPALSWVDRTVTRIRNWLKSTFAPAFAFLKHVRDELTLVWRRFVRPVLDVIDFVHQLDRLLQVFHINVLKGIDTALQSFESKVQEGFLWVTGKLNEISNVLTTIVTADGFFQRYTLLRSLARDVDLHFNQLVNSKAKPLGGAAAYKITRAFETPTVAQATAAAAAWLNGDASDDAASLDAAVATWAEFANQDDGATA